MRSLNISLCFFFVVRDKRTKVLSAFFCHFSSTRVAKLLLILLPLALLLLSVWLQFGFVPQEHPVKPTVGAENNLESTRKMSNPVYSYPNSLQHPELTSKKDYHGTEIEDSYTWLEDPNAPDVKKWVDEQNVVTDKYLKGLYYSPKISQRNTGLQNQSVLYIQKTLKGEATVFFDPNTLSADGTTAISTYAFSESGRYFAYGLSHKGSDWTEIHIKTVDGEDEMASKISEQLSWVKFSGIQWTLDDSGFFYSRFPKPASLDPEAGQSAGTETESNLNHQIYYHKLGTSQDEDLLICRTPDNPKWTMGSQVSEDGDLLFITIHESTDPVNLLWYGNLKSTLEQAAAHKADASKPEPQFTKFVNSFEAEFDYLTNEGNLVFFKTNLDAPRYKVISIDLSKPEKANWKDVIPQHEKDVLSYATVVNQNKLVVVHIRDVADVMALYSLPNGEFIRDLELATLGSIVSLNGKKHQSEFFYKFTSFLHPGSIYHFNFEEKDLGKQLIDFRHTTIPGYDANQFETHRLFYNSKDGTRVPLFVVHKKGLQLNGSNPTLLYGYGGFSVPIQPYFSSFNLVWMQNLGGVYAVANIRGGSEYGEEWHKAGTKGQKQNVFDDFQAAGEFLISQKYTQASKLSIFGGSNGGLLVAACINQRPELFGAAIAAVGVMDMLNFHRHTIGHAWTGDYGCADNQEDFNYLIKYSPLHNVQANKVYPATLLTTADHDDRVVPLHSYKLIGALQTKAGSNPNQVNPLLIRVETKAGHSSGKPTSKVIEEKADMFTFLALALKIQWQD